MGFDARKAARNMNLGFERFQRDWGATVQWFEWDGAEAAADDETDIYDEGTATNPRRWLPPKVVQIMSVIRVEGEERPTAEGFYTVDHIHLTASVEQLRRNGLHKVDDAQWHLFDRFVWDNFVWEVRRFQIQARLTTIELLVGIDAMRVKDEEMLNDIDFIRFFPPRRITSSDTATVTEAQVRS